MRTRERGASVTVSSRVMARLRNGYRTPLTLVILLLIWQFSVMIFNVPEYILPTPLSAIQHLIFAQPDANYNWAVHITTTLYEIAVSFAVTAATGILLAIVLSWSQSVSNLAMPLFVFVNSLPIIAVAPIILLWFGYGLVTNVFIALLI